MLDAVFLVFFTLGLFFLSYRQSRFRMFWGDEVMGSYVLRSGSWHRFLELWHGGIDSSGFWFYVLAKPWEWICGASEISIRMFSAVGIAGSAALIWITARRFYSFLVVATAISLPYLDIACLRWQLSNGRCYGVLMASTALVIYMIVRGSENTYRMPRLPFLVATFLAYSFIAGSHILGVLFAGMLLAVQIAVDVRASSLRPKLYASALAGIVATLSFSWQNIRSTTALGKPVFWTVKPILRALYLGTDLTDSPIKWPILLLFASTFLLLRRRAARDVIYLFLLACVLLHTGFVLISQVSTSIYVDRYLLPLTFGLVFLLAELLTQMREVESISRVRCYFVFVALWVVALSGAPRPTQFYLPIYDYTNAMLADLPTGLPVVNTDVGTFVEVEYYHHGKFGRPYLFPLDDQVTRDLTNPGGVSGFHELDNFARFKIDVPDLQPTAEILGKYPDFLVLTSVAPTSWFRRRIQESGAYSFTDLGPRSYGPMAMHLWKVHRLDPQTSASTGRGRE